MALERTPHLGSRRCNPYNPDAMSINDQLKSRRAFLKHSSVGLAAAAVGCHSAVEAPKQSAPAPTAAAAHAGPPPAGSPPAFGTAPPVGPVVSAVTFVEAEKLVQVSLTPAEQRQAASNWRQAMAPLYERRVGPRKVALAPSLAPATQWNPMLPGMPPPPQHDHFVPAPAPFVPLPTRDDDIAFANLAQLGRWIHARQLTSERLTGIYLERLERFNPTLRCVITLTKDHALEQARAADREISAGRYRGPLHGIPWGAKDLLDTANIPTTYGAEPFRDRVPKTDATVVERLNEAGAVLVAKLSLGALALNDIWFGGQTMNPWLLEEGASGSSAGPGAATAAGLVGFAIGSETGGSIVSPSMRCGVTGLRPTYGRVPRTGAMTLCWSLDKLGPMARSVEDTMLVLRAISGPTMRPGGDLACVPSHLDYNAVLPVKGIRIGYIPAWLAEPPATDVDRAAIDQVKKLGHGTRAQSHCPTGPTIRSTSSSSPRPPPPLKNSRSRTVSTNSRRRCPTPGPTPFVRRAFSLPSISCRPTASAAKLPSRWSRSSRKSTCCSCPRSVTKCSPSPTSPDIHRSLCAPASWKSAKRAATGPPTPTIRLPKFSPPRRVPHGVTLIGQLFDEGMLGRVGVALERAFNVASERPKGFS